MESLVLVDPVRGRFCELTWEGAHVEIAEGAEGTEGEIEQHAFASPAQAREFVADFVTAQRARGFRDAEDAPREPEASEENADLYAHIAADPDDPARLLVLADWLQAQGHPRGQLVVLQDALARDPSSEALRADVEELVEAHRGRFFGDLADAPELADVALRRGFAERVVLFRRHPATLDLDAEALTRGFLAHPTCRFVRRLVLSLPSSDHSPPQTHALLAALPDSAMPTVRALQIGDPTDLDSALRVPAALASTFPNLEELAVFGNGMTFERASYDALRTLVVVDHLPESRVGLERCSFPKLERLILGATLDPLRAVSVVRQLRSLEFLFDVQTSRLEELAACNASAFEGPDQIVLHGDARAAARIERVARRLEDAGVRVTRGIESVDSYAVSARDLEEEEEELDEGDGEGDDGDDDGWEEGDEDDPLAAQDDDEADDEVEEEEPGVDEDWEEPKENPLDIGDEESEDDAPELA